MDNISSSASKLTILTANVNGFRNDAKRREFYSHIKSANSDILCLTDTRFDNNLHRLIENETDHFCYFNSFQSNARGVAILVSKTCPIKILSQHNDASGNLLWLKCIYEENSLLLCVIYGPNEDSPEFFDNIFEFYEQANISDCIITGDFNVTINHDLDNYRYVQPRNVRARECLNKWMSDLGFIDAYRCLHGDKKMFTWTKKGGPQRARLDLFLTTESLRPYITSLSKMSSYKSDHNPVIITIDYSKFQRGKGFWKHNSSLLSDLEYATRIKNTIKVTCAKYLKHNSYENFYQESSDQEIADFLLLDFSALHLLDYNINPNLLLDMLLNDIKNETISYSTAKHLRENRHEKELLENLTRLQELNCGNNPPINISDELANAEATYTEFVEGRAYKTFLSSKVTSKLEGEKPTRFFCNLEKNFNAQKYISRLKVTDYNGSEILLTSQSDIEAEIKNFYEDLYNNHDNDLTNELNDFLDPSIPHPKLSESQVANLEQDITLEELASVLKKSRNNSTPGSSGFSYGFYKFFWLQLGPFILKAAHYSFNIGKLPSSQTVGIISLIPKGEKPKEFLDSWRPITLQNSIYKLISGVIAQRINTVLPTIIHTDQCGFVPGRYIGDCIRTTYDVIEYAKCNNKTGLLLLIDFKKAFDSISFKFIESTLDYFGFGNNYKKWINILLNNFKACINHAGNISSLFNILRGCRQGDPIAAALFILSIEILCIKLRSSTDIRCFKIEELNILLSLYADDCSIFLEYHEDSLKNTIHMLNDFYKTSGLQIQVSKTQCVCFGNVPINNILCPELGLRWNQDFKLLGVNFNGTLNDMDSNFDLKINEIKSVINKWQYRFISPIGRACLAKTLLLSKLAHLAFVLPMISNNKIKQIENLIYNFIWQGKEKVARIDSKHSEIKGGLNFPDVQSSWNSYKFSWFRRLAKSKTSWSKIFELNLTNSLNISLDIFFTELGTLEYTRLEKIFPNTFWKSCIHVVKPLLLEHLRMHPDNIIIYPIWGSSVFMINSLECKRNNFGRLGNKVSYPLDFIKTENNCPVFLSEQELRAKFDVEIDPMHYISLKHIVTVGLQKLNLSLDRLNITMPYQPPLIRLINYSSQGCNRWVKLLKRLDFSNRNLQARERKWEVELGTMQGNEFWEKTYLLTKDIFYDNRLKWMQYQIVRGTLKTNKIISKFIPSVNANCTFCQNSVETILHLFWDCEIVSTFLEAIYDYFITRWDAVSVIPTRKEFIFGKKTKRMYTPENLLILYVKYYIWVIRCRKINLNFTGFLKWFRFELKINHMAFIDNPNFSYLNDNSYRMELILPL